MAKVEFDVLWSEESLTLVYFESAWTNTVSVPFGIFCCFPLIISCIYISSRFAFMVGYRHFNMWSMSGTD